MSSASWVCRVFLSLCIGVVLYGEQIASSAEQSIESKLQVIEEKRDARLNALLFGDTVKAAKELLTDKATDIDIAKGRIPDCRRAKSSQPIAAFLALRYIYEMDRWDARNAGDAKQLKSIEADITDCIQIICEEILSMSVGTREKYEKSIFTGGELWKDEGYKKLHLISKYAIFLDMLCTAKNSGTHKNLYDRIIHDVIKNTISIRRAQAMEILIIALLNPNADDIAQKFKVFVDDASMKIAPFLKKTLDELQEQITLETDPMKLWHYRIEIEQVENNDKAWNVAAIPLIHARYNKTEWKANAREQYEVDQAGVENFVRTCLINRAFEFNRIRSIPTEESPLEVSLYKLDESEELGMCELTHGPYKYGRRRVDSQDSAKVIIKASAEKFPIRYYFCYGLMSNGAFKSFPLTAPRNPLMTLVNNVQMHTTDFFFSNLTEPPSGIDTYVFYFAPRPYDEIPSAQSMYASNKHLSDSELESQNACFQKLLDKGVEFDSYHLVVMSNAVTNDDPVHKQ